MVTTDDQRVRSMQETLKTFQIPNSIGASLFLFATGTRALQYGVVVTGIALFAIGATLSLFTGRSAWYSGSRMLLLGALAGAVTFGIGRLFGVALG